MHCGSALSAAGSGRYIVSRNKNSPPAPGDFPEVRRVTPNILLCEDGKYRWKYEMSLLKNPTIFLLVWKILFFIILGIFAVLFLIDWIDWGELQPERLWDDLRFFVYFVVGMTVITGVSYLVYAAIMGGKYCVIFEMDEKGINHKQAPEQAQKARRLSRMTIAAGIAAGRMSAVSAGMSAARTEMYSDFASVRKIKCYPMRHLIKVNGLLEHNQVYAAKEDYEFVRNYIMVHCPNIKK